MKGKKLLASLLACLMVLGTVVVPAFAADLRIYDTYCGLDSHNDYVMLLTIQGFSFGTEDDVELKTYSGDKLLAVTKQNQKWEAPNGTTVKVNFTTGGDPEDVPNWVTEIKSAWTTSTIPDKAEVYVNGVLQGSVVPGSGQNEYLVGSVRRYDNFADFFKGEIPVAKTQADIAALINAADAGDEIDLGTDTYIFDEDIATLHITKSITIKGGVFDITNQIFQNCNGVIWVTDGAEVTFDGTKIKGKNYSSYGVICVSGGKVTLKGCEFNLENEVMSEEDEASGEDEGGVLKGNESGEEIKIIGGTYTFKNVVRGIVGANVAIEDATITDTETGTPTASFFRNVFGTIKNSTITASGFQYGIKNSSAGTLEVKENSVVTFENMTENDVKLTTGATVKKDSTSTITLSNTACEAEVDGVIYATLAEAVRNAQPGSTITLLKDAEVGQTRFFNSINLNGKTLTLPKTDSNIESNGHDVVFSNGSIVVKDGLYSNAKAIIRILTGNNKFVFDGIKFTSTDTDMAYVLEVMNGNFEIKDSEINIDGHKGAGNEGEKQGAALASNNSTQILIENSEVNISNSLCGVLHGVKLVDSTFTATNITEEAFKSSIAEVELDNSEVKVDGCQIGIKLYPDNNLVVNNGSTFEVLNASLAGIYLRGNAAATKDETSTINAFVYEEDASESVTENITASLRQTSEEGEFEIVVKADEGKYIHGFASAEFKLDIPEGAEVVEKSEDVTIVKNPAKANVYAFEASEGVLADAEEIVLGKVVIYRTGEYEIGINNEYANLVYATKYGTTDEALYNVANDNLTIGEKIPVTLTPATRNVQVNVEFEHDVFADVEADYVYMTVTLKDVFGNKTTKDIAVSDVDTTDDSTNGTVTFEDVPVGLVTVTLEGNGYRKYSYQTNMKETEEDEVFVLNFWNSVKKNSQTVENGGKGMFTNFLAGDIVMDYIIDAYDIAAVTSYYGTYENEDANLVKYDLNRDGNIDITDVAYVIHSLGF